MRDGTIIDPEIVKGAAAVNPHFPVIRVAGIVKD